MFFGTGNGSDRNDGSRCGGKEAGEECELGDLNGKGDCTTNCKVVPEDEKSECWDGVCSSDEKCEECPLDCGWCIVPQECNSCPCEYAEYTSDLLDTDKIYAVLRQRGLKVLYAESPSYGLSDFMSQD